MLAILRIINQSCQTKKKQRRFLNDFKESLSPVDVYGRVRLAQWNMAVLNPFH